MRRVSRRPATRPEVVNLILRLARENSSWGYDRIAGALINLGHKAQIKQSVTFSAGTASPFAPKRSQTTRWKDFIASHMAVITGMDFFSVEILTWRGLITYYVLFVIQLETRRVILAGITQHPTEQWMQQIARNLSDSESGAPTHQTYLLHDHDTKFCSSFTATLSDGGVQPLRLPARSPNLNGFAERWVRSVKQECLSKLILFSEASLRRVLTEYLAHYHTERNHQGKHNLLLFPAPVDASPLGKPILCKQRLGGLLKYYARAA